MLNTNPALLFQKSNSAVLDLKFKFRIFFERRWNETNTSKRKRLLPSSPSSDSVLDPCVLCSNSVPFWAWRMVAVCYDIDKKRKWLFWGGIRPALSDLVVAVMVFGFFDSVAGHVTVIFRFCVMCSWNVVVLDVLEFWFFEPVKRKKLWIRVYWFDGCGYSVVFLGQCVIYDSLFIGCHLRVSLIQCKD